MSGSQPDPKSDKPREDSKKEREHEEEQLDDALEDTFPASDPVAPQDPTKPGGS